MRRCRVVDGPISSLGWLRVAVLRPCNHPAQSYVSGVLPASEKSTTDNAIDREESRTPTYNNNNNNEVWKNDYNIRSGTQELFLFPGTLCDSHSNLIHTHSYTVPVCVLFLCRYNNICQGTLYIPLATDSMPAPLILGPTCTMLIHIPTR